jgi:hypothetical protein
MYVWLFYTHWTTPVSEYKVFQLIFTNQTVFIHDCFLVRKINEQFGHIRR